MRTRTALVAVAAAAFAALGATTAAADGGAAMIALDRQSRPTATESFVGTPVAVPGDVVGRTLTVRNTGPGASVLAVAITDVTISQDAASDTFYHDLQLRWTTAAGTGQASFASLVGSHRPVVEVPVAAGQSTQVTIEYVFPLNATSGNRSRVGERTAGFTVVLELTESTDSGGPDAEIDTGLIGLSETGLAVALAAMAVGTALMLTAWLRRRPSRRR
ncbi:MAG: hypothetical protein J0I14_17455 [Propionibacteriaceae bacterium]|nr:hypothetical protein [Propionibacteriaceae bacterium]